MAIHYITIKGRIKDGVLEAKVPAEVQDGEIEVQLPIDEQDLTEEMIQNEFTFQAVPSDQLVLGGWEDMGIEEIADLMRPEPKTGAEIAKNPAIGSWADKGITDSVEWLAEQRQKRREKRGW